MNWNEGHSYRELIDQRSAGRSVIDWLAERYRHSERETWLSRIAGGEVVLDGRRALPDELLMPGQELVWNRPPWREPEVPIDYAILHEDDSIVAVSKPSGLPTMPGGGFLENTLWSLLRQRFPDAAPLHRLGRGTSGLVLFARSDRARIELSAAFRERRIRKIYRALAAGDPPWENQEIRVRIGEVDHGILGTIHGASEDGKEAVSFAKVVERKGDVCILDVEIETGRPHQIRIHLAAVGHPLVGDPLYLSGGRPRADALPGDLGYHLHAWRVSFAHPAKGAPFQLEAPLPDILLAPSDED